MPQFKVRVLEHRRLGPDDNIWQLSDYRALLEAADYADADVTPDEELRDMCLMVLQDLEPPEAAILVLTHHLGERLTKGQIHNLAHELGDEKHWEHYADMTLHEGIFHVSSLMWEAFPGVYPKPDAVGLTLEVHPANDAARELLTAGLEASLLVRLLADGMPSGAILHRLFDDQLAGACFPEASAIVWTWSGRNEGEAVRVDVTGSQAWLGPVQHNGSWESSAQPDAPEVEED